MKLIIDIPDHYTRLLGFDNDELTGYFDTVATRTDFKMWFFGHYHRTELIKDKYMALFDAIVKLGE